MNLYLYCVVCWVRKKVLIINYANNVSVMAVVQNHTVYLSY